MPGRICALFFSVLAALPAAAARPSPAALHVDEPAIRAELTDRTVRVALAVRNSGPAAPARLRVELLDPQGAVIAAADRAASVQSGRSVQTIEVPRPPAYLDTRDLITSRLRYRVEPGTASGLVALSEAVRDVFELTAIAPSRAVPGGLFSVQVRASNPAGGAPVARVALAATLELEDGADEVTLAETARTGGDGLATLSFEIPAGRRFDDGSLEIAGRLGGFVDEIDEDLDFDEETAAVLVTTDKGLYQPGQTLHVRCLAFDESTGERRALAGAPVEIEVEDERGETQYRETVETSRFGVASVDWAIPDGAKLGPYFVNAEIDDEAHEGRGRAYVAVSRYDLPTFAVAAEPDRGYYLPGEDAEVTVRADYLFGKPVPRGRVRLVREQSRAWSYDEQKWIVEEGAAVEGEAGEDGRFVARVGLGEEHERLARDGYARFRDLTFAAYVTDPQTNRTEQRRLDLRVSRDAIHLYPVALDAAAADFETEFYLTASYADGSPAACDVRVLGPARDGWRQLAAVRTNRYGVARVGDVVFPAGATLGELRFEARDGAGRSGTHVESVSLEDAAIRVATDKALYRPGEPIWARIASSTRDAVAVVELFDGARTVASRTVRLRDGRASTVFGYRPGFRDADLSVAATLLEPAGPARRYYDWPVTSARGVLYPSNEALTVTIAGTRDEYRPGDEVRATARLRDAEGRGVAGALGVVVVDRAVVERERTNREFGASRGLAGGMLDEGARVGDLTRRALARLDLTRPVPEDLALAAEVLLLTEARDRHEIVESWHERVDLRRAFASSFDPLVARVRGALAAHVERSDRFPADEAEFLAVVRGAGLDPEADNRDPWGTPIVWAFSYRAPYHTLHARSAGPDERYGTRDDVDVDRYSWLDLRATRRADEITFAVPRYESAPGNAGAISGTITDPQGAVIAGADVTVVDSRQGVEVAAATDGEGRYTIAGLRPGVYELRVEAAGFGVRVVSVVLVRSSTITIVDAELNVTGAAEMVEVTAGESGLQFSTTSQTLATRVTEREVGDLPAGARGTEISTPRVRQYFPETLYWQPSLETDRRGRATIAFPLADSVTTWRLAAVASTEDGRIATVEADLRAFQPFFVEHDPPKVLTVGDEISLPVVVRNYLDEAHDVEVDVRPEPWLAVAGPSSRRVRLAAGESANATFDLRATAPVDPTPHRVTATGERAGDAVERPVSVHPDGEPRDVTASQIFGAAAAFDVSIPEDAIAVARAEVKLYVDLADHVVESVEGLLRRPYGCGEQTISSTYPSLLLLEHGAGRLDAALDAKVRRYARMGTDRLLGYQKADGGFGYWGDTPSDAALTAYALRFLADARKLGLVDDEVVSRTRAYLAARQLADGTWPGGARQTAFVARSLAAIGRGAAPDPGLRRALAALGATIPTADDPYVVASYALAALDAGLAADAARAVERLAALARSDGDARWWELGGETPLHGWGRAGHVETTALAVEALERAAAAGLGGPSLRALSGAGLAYVLGNKDRYGVWYSTRATIAVLDAMLAITSGQRPTGAVEVLVGGERVAAIDLAAARGPRGPVVVPLANRIAPGATRIEIRRSDGSAPLMAQFVGEYYAPWPQEAASRGGRAERATDALRFSVAYDRVEAAPGDRVTCTVEAARTAQRGYGMLIAEVGIPPGAAVDRESLERAVAESGWNVNRYDVLPDRVVVYVWPQWAGAARFSFSFRPRYAISALAAPSTLYDYYNPDAAVALAPPRFVIGER